MRLHLLLAILALATRTVAGPFTGNGTQPGIAFPPLKASNCQTCHGNFDPAHDVEPWPTWAGSMMAQASRDPLFWAALDVANHDVPSAGSWCLRCHVPEGWLAGRAEAPTGTADGCTLSGQLDTRDSDFEGVACHLCHRLMRNPSPPPGQLDAYLENAQWWVDDGTCGGQGEPCRRAQYDYPAGGPTPPPHPWAASPYHASSELCGICHNVTNPQHDLVIDGVGQGIRFPIERTYREWLLSDFARPGASTASCQDCHMAESGLAPAFACASLATNRAGDMRVPRLMGANTFIPDVLRATYPSLGLEAELSAARAGALDMLQNRSATVTVLPTGPVAPGGTLHATVQVTNLTGHKLPTGYPEGRRMWLAVEATDATDTLLWQSGGYDAATGVLAADAQLKVYEAKHGVWNGATGRCEADASGVELFHFVKNDCVALDDRIPPLGFTGGADPETNPVGYAYPEAAPGVLVNYDRTEYAIPIPAGATPPVTVRATLRYQTVSKAYVDFLDGEATANGFPTDCVARTTGPLGKTRARFLKDLWQANGRAAPVDMASASASIDVRPIDAFTCDKVRATAGSSPFVAPPAGLALANAFDSATFAVRKPKDLCLTADLGAGQVDASTDLTAYPLKAMPGQPVHVRRSGLVVTDALGSLSLDTIRPDLLLVPTTASLVAPPSPPGATRVDAFACYKVRTTPGAAHFVRTRIAAADALTSEPSALDLKRPKELCLPSGIGGGATIQPDVRLLCYQAAPAPGVLPTYTPRSGIWLANVPLGAGRVDTRTQQLVCLPATVAP
jgi:hypothetical protein